MEEVITHAELVTVSMNDIYVLPPKYKDEYYSTAFQSLVQKSQVDSTAVPIRLIKRDEGGYYLFDGYSRCHVAILISSHSISAMVEGFTLLHVEALAKQSSSKVEPPARDEADVHITEYFRSKSPNIRGNRRKNYGIDR